MPVPVSFTVKCNSPVISEQLNTINLSMVKLIDFVIGSKTIPACPVAELKATYFQPPPRL